MKKRSSSHRETSCEDCGGPLLFLENDKGPDYPLFADQQNKEGGKCEHHAPEVFKNELRAAQVKVTNLFDEARSLLPEYDFGPALEQLIGKKNSRTKRIAETYGGRPNQYGFARRELLSLQNEAQLTVAGIMNESSLSILEGLDESVDRRVPGLKGEISDLEEQRLLMLRQGFADATVRGGEERRFYPGHSLGAAKHKLLLAAEIRDKQAQAASVEEQQQEVADRAELEELKRKHQLLVDLEFEIDQDLLDRIAQLESKLEGDEPNEVPDHLRNGAGPTDDSEPDGHRSKATRSKTAQSAGN